MTGSTIASRLLHQRERIAQAASRAGRDEKDVHLIAVSKKQSVQAIREAYEAGQRDFGENYVQELVAKAEELKDLRELRWHMIGHLQTNKCRFVAGLVERIHTITSVKLATELGRRVAQRRRTVAASPHGARLSFESGEMSAPPVSTLPLGVLVEVNVSREESKDGCAPEELEGVLKAIDEQPLLFVTGLMTVAPACENAEDSRPSFEALARLRDQYGGTSRLPELSMGMSHDAEVAVSAGATCVRIGSAIFGAREG